MYESLKSRHGWNSLSIAMLTIFIVVLLGVFAGLNLAFHNSADPDKTSTKVSIGAGASAAFVLLLGIFAFYRFSEKDKLN